MLARNIVLPFLSVRPSVQCRIVSKRMHISSYFWQSERDIILVFLALPSLRNFKGNPVGGGIKYTGVGKNLRFSTEVSVYLGNGTRQARGYYVSTNMKSYVADRSVSVPMTVSGLEGQNARGQIGISRIISTLFERYLDKYTIWSIVVQFKLGHIQLHISIKYMLNICYTGPTSVVVGLLTKTVTQHGTCVRCWRPLQATQYQDPALRFRL